MADHSRLSPREAVPIICGMAKLRTRPSTVPPMVISSGMMKWSKSIKVATTISDTKITPGSTRIQASWKCSHTARKSRPVSPSMAG